MGSAPTYCIMPLCYRRVRILGRGPFPIPLYFLLCFVITLLSEKRQKHKKIYNKSCLHWRVVCTHLSYLWSVSTWIKKEVRPGHIIIAYCSLILLLNYTGGLRAEQILWNILKKGCKLIMSEFCSLLLFALQSPAANPGWLPSGAETILLTISCILIHNGL